MAANSTTIILVSRFTTPWCLTRGPGPAPRRSAFGGAVDAEARCGFGLQPGRGDGLAARLAAAVVSARELLQGVLDLSQGVLQAVGQRLGIAAFGRHLARIGEVGV